MTQIKYILWCLLGIMLLFFVSDVFLSPEAIGPIIFLDSLRTVFFGFFDFILHYGGTLFTVLVVGFIYFLPFVVARAKSHHNSSGVFVLNLFLGWTIIGWVLALVWSVTKPAD